MSSIQVPIPSCRCTTCNDTGLMLAACDGRKVPLGLWTPDAGLQWIECSACSPSDIKLRDGESARTEELEEGAVID